MQRRVVCTNSCVLKGVSRGSSHPLPSAHACRRAHEACGVLLPGRHWSCGLRLALFSGPGPGLRKEAGACVRRPEGGVRGMGEKSKAGALMSPRRPCRCVRELVTSQACVIGISDAGVWGFEPRRLLLGDTPNPRDELPGLAPAPRLLHLGKYH